MIPTMRPLRVALFGLCAAAAGCSAIADIQPLDDAPSRDVPLPADAVVGVSGARRLSRVEYDSTLKDLLGDDTKGGYLTLPEDVADPFDNDFKQQQPSSTLITSAETLADEAATRLLASPAKMDVLLQCAPSGPGDAACLRKFVTNFGRRAYRRELTEDEITRFLSLQSYAVEANDFTVGVRLIIRAVLQEPEFLYRIERGTPAADNPDVFALNDYEIATRLSYFLWGSTPPDWLLDAARAEKLSSTEEIRAAAERLLQDPRAEARVERFHMMWLGYQTLPHSAQLAAAMKDESNALVDRVALSDADYFDLFTADTTYLSTTLAQHYGLNAPQNGSADWVTYGATAGRKGILSHGSVLSQGAKFSDTSPTLRGKFIRERLLCQVIPPPPPNANVDQPPASASSPCKKDRYSDHANVGSCAGCHSQMDPIGFGLENFDQTGRFRATDNNLPQCVIEGTGTLTGIGDFKGPAGLADALTQSGQLEGCVVRQVYRFAMGRREMPADAALIDNLTEAFKSKNRGFRTLLLDVVSDATFAYRKEE